MEKLPNIVLIVCDTLGAKHMSLYGYHRKTTPMLERLVEEEGFTVYKNCYSTSCWTPPAHASLFTGLYPNEHGTHEALPLLSDELLVMPEILTMLGYETIGISCNGLVSEQFGFSRGFTQFIALDKYHIFKIDNEILTLIRQQKNKFNKFWTALKISFKEKDFFLPFKYKINSFYHRIIEKYHFNSALKNATPYTQKALNLTANFLKITQKPLFLFINLMQTHNDYNPPPETKGTWSIKKSPFRKISQNAWNHYYKEPYSFEILNYLQDLYDEEVLYLDKVIYNFYYTIKKLSNSKDTIFIITSDHGENFGEEGHFGHIISLTEAGCKIPLLIKYPWNTTPDYSNRLCQINDLFATVCDIIQSPIPTPDSAVSLLSSTQRKKALMEIVHPEVWLEKIKYKEKFNFSFRKEVMGVEN